MMSTRVLYDIRVEGIAAKGRADLIRFHSGRRVTPMQAIRAKCYDCMGYYADGRKDCGQTTCPLYRFMPYRDVDREDSDESPGGQDGF